jgi:hypothetical protein
MHQVGSWQKAVGNFRFDMPTANCLLPIFSIPQS